MWIYSDFEALHGSAFYRRVSHFYCPPTGYQHIKNLHINSGFSLCLKITIALSRCCQFSFHIRRLVFCSAHINCREIYLKFMPIRLKLNYEKMGAQISISSVKPTLNHHLFKFALFRNLSVSVVVYFSYLMVGLRRRPHKPHPTAPTALVLPPPTSSASICISVFQTWHQNQTKPTPQAIPSPVQILN